MLKIFGPISVVAVAIIVLVTAIGVSTPVGGAYANDCVGAPKTASPHGQHWYYRIDRSTRRKCWYLRGFLSRSHQAAKSSEAHLAAAQSTIAVPAPPSVPSAEAARPAGHGSSAVHQPEVKILSVRTVQFANPPTVQAPQQRAEQQTAAPSVLPASGNENRNPPNAANATAAVKPTTEDQYPLPANVASSPPKADRPMKPQAVATIGPTEIFLLLVLGIGLATLLLGVVIQRLGRQHAVPILEDPDSAWRRYRLGDQRPDLEASNALASPARPRLEPAPRALREARQHVAA